MWDLMVDEHMGRHSAQCMCGAVHDLWGDGHMLLCIRLMYVYALQCMLACHVCASCSSGWVSHQHIGGRFERFFSSFVLCTCGSQHAFPHLHPDTSSALWPHATMTGASSASRATPGCCGCCLVTRWVTAGKHAGRCAAAHTVGSPVYAP